ncbi:MAG: hypothetical protein OQK75_13635 [Gammaproteobacteria bacterium]|nr:hypothetical protein [Gammaproteobacteria bacterium]MCW8988701.1 hypothetical protein [Gammaproteobacteria bacterium]
MHKTTGAVSNLLGAFHMADVSMRYSLFVPRVYNLALSLGFEAGKIMPSRAFCSDESQGYPIILLAKHFSTFPFNHGVVGGVVATDRHRPHAHHGKDLIIIQASHVGYDPKTEEFGTYRRLQTEQQNETSNCGKICGVLDRYLKEYEFARHNIYLANKNGQHKVIIDNQLLHIDREEGLFLKLNQFVDVDERGEPLPEYSKSTAKVFNASPNLNKYLQDYKWEAGNGAVIDKYLHPDLFYYKRKISEHEEGHDHLESNLINIMPYIVASDWPALTAAQANTQVEFDRTFRTISQEPAYKGKKVLFISGLNVDISPQKDQLFPLTKFIPWAAYAQDEKGNQQTWEQAELFEKLQAQSTENPDQINLESAIEIMHNTKEIHLPF